MAIVGHIVNTFNFQFPNIMAFSPRLQFPISKSHALELLQETLRLPPTAHQQWATLSISFRKQTSTDCFLLSLLLLKFDQQLLSPCNLPYHSISFSLALSFSNTCKALASFFYSSRKNSKNLNLVFKAFAILFYSSKKC